MSWRRCARTRRGLVALWSDVLEPTTIRPRRSSPICATRTAIGCTRCSRVIASWRRAARSSPARACDVRREIPLVAATEVLYHSRARRPLQDVLTCIRHGVTLATAGRATQTATTSTICARRTRSSALSPTSPRRSRARSTRRALHVHSRPSCAIAIRRSGCPTARPRPITLRRLVAEGAVGRYPDGVPAELGDAARARSCGDRRARLPRLLPDDVRDRRRTAGGATSCVRVAARRRTRRCASASASPRSIRCSIDLLFERFLSRERAEPPDIDLDIEHERREEVIQHVYAKYGRDHAAMVCQRDPLSAALGGARRRQGARHSGDRARSRREAPVDVRRSRRAALSRGTRGGRSDAIALDAPHAARRRDARISRATSRCIRGGFLLGHEPVHDIVPIENATMAGRTVIQWDKDDVEDLGLFKVDLLGARRAAPAPPRASI